MFSIGQNHMLMEDAGTPLDGNYTFNEAEMTQVLDSYADLHGAFWNIPKVELLRSAEWWGAVFTGSFLGKEEMDRWLDWRMTPEPYLSLIRRARDELGFERIFEFMNRHGVTLAQGDAHNGQLLRLSELASSTHGGRKFGIIDFGTAVRANPAVDVGSILRSLNADKRHEEFDFVRYYLKSLRLRLGEHATTLKMTDEDFFHDYKLGKLFRILFEGTFQWMSLPDEIKNNANYPKGFSPRRQPLPSIMCVAWLVGWLACRQTCAGWQFVCFAGWLTGCMVGWLAGFLAGLLSGDGNQRRERRRRCALTRDCC
ncbi:unnamed protein product [Prorocentrum cordatum]|nr:unnamed protein product [Polarella glacialis]